MKTFKLLIIATLVATVAALLAAAAKAADLDYTTVVPQAGDTELVIAHKLALAQSPTLYRAIATTGTTTLTGVAELRRIVVGTAGSADSAIVVTDGTTALASVTTAAQADLTLGVVIGTGTVKIVNTGTTSGTLTIGYR